MNIGSFFGSVVYRLSMERYREAVDLMGKTSPQDLNPVPRHICGEHIEYFLDLAALAQHAETITMTAADWKLLSRPLKIEGIE